MFNILRKLLKITNSEQKELNMLFVAHLQLFRKSFKNERTKFVLFASRVCILLAIKSQID